MKKLLCLLCLCIMFVSARALSTHSGHSDAVTFTPNETVETVPKPVTNIYPYISGEHRTQYMPVAYGNASQIGFSNGIMIDTRMLGKDNEPVLDPDLVYDRGEAAYHIVQFSGPVYEQQKQWLEDQDVGIHMYMPNYGFVCRMSSAQADMIRSHAQITWVGIYQPAYKISSLFDLVGDEHRVTILLFMDADMNTIKEQVKTVARHEEFETSDNGINKMILGSLRREDIAAIAHIPGVYWVEPYIQPVHHNNNVQWIVQSGSSGVRSIWAHGIRGEGEIVNDCDSGINTSHYQHRSGSSAVGTWGYYPTHNAIVAYDSGAPSNIAFGDGPGASYHGTHTTGTLTGDDTTHASSSRDGVALKAKVYFNDCGDNTSSSIYTYADYNDLYGRSYNKYYPPTRAYISTNSWGSAVSGAYTSSSMGADQFMWAHKDYLLCYSAGNSGPSSMSIGAPASAKSVVTVGGCINGSTTQYLNIYTWGSRGPCADGRLKPTIITPAQSVWSSTSGTSNYSSMSGTSMASPSAAGSAALIRQYLREGWYPTGTQTASDAFSFISASLLKAMLVNSADTNINSYTQVPNNGIGWGRVDLDTTLYFSGETRKTLLVDNTVGVLTSEQVDYHFNIPSGATSLKITLCWTDYPGNPAVSPQIVNDLDLVARVGGTYYNGNQYSGNQSIANPSGRDTLNVVECVRRHNPTAGDWTISVCARNVPYGPQPFSIVVTYSASGLTGFVSVDKPVYRANDFVVDTVRVRVEDTNYGSAGTVDQVMVVINSSLTETQPETLYCTELGANAYVFEGEIPLLFHKPVHGDNRISVCQDDTINVAYTDASPSFVSTTWAGVDSRYFLISDVHCEYIEANSAEVCWTTNDNANSTVHYGTNPSNLNQTVSLDTPFVIPHRVRVGALTEKTVYYYDVESRDFRGNSVRDDNGGQHYTFSTKAGGSGIDVLVVVCNSDGYDDAFIHGDFLRDALDAGGWTYNWWQTKSDGDFSRDMIKQYKAVYFQVGQTGGSGGNYPVWTVAQKETMKTYHDGGARFAMTGHDIGWDPWANSPSADTVFCKNYLHYRYIGDITAISWNTLYGISGDPISGPYTGGVPYQPYRDGAAGDSIRLSGTGAPGTGSYVWHGSAANDSCGIKWESTNDMGTGGDGVWGGHHTRVVSNAFEITQIDTTNPNSSTRINLLNNMFIWLIGHDHPDVTMSSPQGGQTYTSSPLNITWTASAHGGATIDSTWIDYSPDGGQTWIPIVAGTGVSSPYSWNISSLTNGPYYQVRVTVSDQGVYPSMKGADQTADFTISIAGNDFVGPAVLPQSITVGSNPMIVTPSNLLLPVAAAINDSLSGLSNIAAAEWSLGSNPASPGSGDAMLPADGSYNEIQEGVVDTLYCAYNPGTTEIDTIWVRGYDAADNWGNAIMRTFTLIDGQIVIGIAEDGREIPLRFSLSKPVPNPFTKQVVITYGIPRPTKVSLKIYNTLGQVVKTVVNDQTKPGLYTASWDGCDDFGRKVSAGVYFYQMITDEYENTRKMVFVR